MINFEVNYHNVDIQNIIEELNKVEETTTKYHQIFFSLPALNIINEVKDINETLLAMAETTPDPTIKLASISSIQKNTAALLHYCESLELTHGQGKEFLHLLRKEVKKFGHLQNKWALGISNKN